MTFAAILSQGPYYRGIIKINLKQSIMSAPYVSIESAYAWIQGRKYMTNAVTGSELQLLRQDGHR